MTTYAGIDRTTGDFWKTEFITKMTTQIYNGSPLLSTIMITANRWDVDWVPLEPSLGDLVRIANHRPAVEPDFKRTHYAHPVRDAKPSALLENLVSRL